MFLACAGACACVLRMFVCACACFVARSTEVCTLCSVYALSPCFVLQKGVSTIYRGPCLLVIG